MRGLPNFINRAETAAFQVLQSYDQAEFEKLLLGQQICIAFDEAAVNSKEGMNTLDMLIRLLARLYPCLKIQCLTQGIEGYKLELEDLAVAINPAIELNSDRKETAYLIVGVTPVEADVPTFYVGSDSWIVKFSDTTPVGIGSTSNPLGAGAAACFGAANLFRYVFNGQLPYSRLDQAFSLSLIDYKIDSVEANASWEGEINIGEIYLAGAGAIGNSFIWSLSKITALIGKLVIVDGQEVELSNLQRYVLTDQQSKKRKKVDIAKEQFQPGALEVEVFPDHWGPYMESRKNWYLETVAVGLDSAEDRIHIQASLPHRIFNAWTQTNDLGVSRHLDFVNQPCLACLYIPTQAKKSVSEEMAENFGFTSLEEEKLVGSYLALNRPVDQDIIARISLAKSIPIAELEQYIGMPLPSFYSEVVCGKMLMDMQPTTKGSNLIEVPLAFQSALAGIMLAAEVLIFKMNIRSGVMSTRTRFNLLKPVTTHNTESCDKFAYGNCLCQDPDYIGAFLSKYHS